MVPIETALAAIAGLLLGSFLNVCIARLPRHRSVVWPGSHCPRCGAPIRPYDNIPIVSYLLLRGRCRACGERISPRYPAVEAGLAGLFALGALRMPSPWAAAEAGALCFFLLGLLVMDAETLLLPDSVTLPGAALGLAVAALPGGGLVRALGLGATVPVPTPTWPPWVGGSLGAAGGAGFLLGVGGVYRLVRKRQGMGLGDVKLAALLGAWLGVAGVALTLLLGMFAGAIAGLVLLARRGGSADVLRLPFGSFLCGAGLVTLFFGRPILTWYFHFWL